VACVRLHDPAADVLVADPELMSSRGLFPPGPLLVSAVREAVPQILESANPAMPPRGTPHALELKITLQLAVIAGLFIASASGRKSARWRELGIHKKESRDTAMLPQIGLPLDDSPSRDARLLRETLLGP
jgi:hypothetical protein